MSSFFSLSILRFYYLYHCNTWHGTAASVLYFLLSIILFCLFVCFCPLDMSFFPPLYSHSHSTEQNTASKSDCVPFPYCFFLSFSLTLAHVQERSCGLTSLDSYSKEMSQHNNWQKFICTKTSKIHII